MSYMALYRKYRPMAFEDVKGQEHIVTALKNQIKYDKVGHAYLFCGTRGTGKTTIAKIFAKALNCENPVDGSPCNECECCKSINEQSSLNVIEIDAASNNSVENVRRIVEEVQYSPTEGRFKVYIIDEVHMLSTSAFNALLKTLEEPPSYVVFILATTEAHKLPVTITSRCQRYDFKRIQVETIVDRLEQLTKAENIDATTDALQYIARNADGALRDALSLLDQCNAFYMGQTLTYEKILGVLGAVDNDVYVNLFELMIKNDVTAVVNLIDDIIMQGKDISQFIINFTWFVRNVMLLKTTNVDASAVDMTQDMAIHLRKLSVEISIDGILRYINVLSEASAKLAYATQKRVVAEMTFIKLLRPQMENNDLALTARIDNIEKKLEKGIVVSGAGAAGADGQTAQEENEDDEGNMSKEELDTLVKALPDDVKELASRWDEVIRKTEEPVKEYLKKAKVYPGEGSCIVLSAADDMEYLFLSAPAHINVLKNVILSVINKDVEIKCVLEKEKAAAGATSVKLDISRLSGLINMPIEVN